VDLARVDEFNQAWASCNTDDGSIASLGFVAAQGDALEAFEFAKALYDAPSGLVEGLCKDLGLVLFVGFLGVGLGAGTGCVAIGIAGMALRNVDSQRLRHP